MAWLRSKGKYWQAGFRDLRNKTYRRSTRVPVKGKDRQETTALKTHAQIVASKIEMAVRGEVGNAARFRETLSELVDLSDSGE